jgi:hypothetical protein
MRALRHQAVGDDRRDLRSRPVREAPGGSECRRSTDGSDRAGSRKRDETLTHIPVIGGGCAARYPLLVESVRIAPEPGAEERQAILAALAAEESERSASSAWADALLLARDDEAEAGP